MSRAWPIARLVTVVLLLLGCVWLGIKEGIAGSLDAATPLQHLAGATQVLYGLGAVASLVGIYLRAQWLKAALAIFGVALAATGGIAPIAWADTGIGVGITTAVTSAGIAIAIGWGALSHVRSTP
jgi:hypothetical protein